MIKEKNINMLEALLKERMAGLMFLENDARSLAEYLAEKSIIVAPVKIGQVVYAGLSKVFTDEPSVIYSWEVKGIGIDENGRYIAFNSYGEHYVVGGESCRLTKAESEEDLRLFEMEYNKVDRSEVGYAEN